MYRYKCVHVFEETHGSGSNSAQTAKIKYECIFQDIV